MVAKRKNIGILIGFILLLFIAYKFSISKTIESRKLHNSLQKQKESLSNLPNQIAYLKQQNKYYDEILEKNQISTDISFQNNLLKIVNSFAEKNNLKITGFKEPHILTQNDAVTKTYNFSVKGNYTSILKLLYSIEQYGNYGRIISVDFQKKKNYKSNSVFLECEVFLQRVEGSSLKGN